VTFVPQNPEPDEESAGDRDAATEAPLAANPPANDPPANKPAVRKPAAKSAAAKPTAAKSTAAKSTAARSTAARSTAAKSTAAKPTAAKSTAATPTAAKPTAATPTAAKPAVTKAGAAETTVSGPSGSPSDPAETPPITPVESKPGTTEPPAARTPAARTAAARKPAARKPAARKPAARKPAAPKTPAAANPSDERSDAPAKSTAQALAQSSTDETTRPYATRDALVTPKADKPVGATNQPEFTSVASAPASKASSKTPRKAVSRPAEPTAAPLAPIVIEARGLVKRFGHTVAVSDLDLSVRAGSFYGIVGPNGAGKTTTLSMITGLLRPTAGTVSVHGIDVWARPNEAKRVIGVLPDRLRLFDRLTGAQLLYYSGTLRGLDNDTVRSRSADLAQAFGIEDALNRLVADYSAGMTKKIALACAMIHSPRVLVLDEPFESVDPVSAVNVTEILQKYVAAGGTVVLSSHGMDLIQRVCDHVAIIVQGRVLAAGTVDEVRGQKTLEDRFVELAGGRKVAEGMEWLHNFSD